MHLWDGDCRSSSELDRSLSSLPETNDTVVCTDQTLCVAVVASTGRVVLALVLQRLLLT